MNKILLIILCLFLSPATFCDTTTKPMDPERVKIDQAIEKLKEKESAGLATVKTDLEAGSYEKVRGHTELRSDYKFNLKCYTTLQKKWDFILSDPDGYVWWCFFRKENGQSEKSGH